MPTWQRGQASAGGDFTGAAFDDLDVADGGEEGDLDFAVRCGGEMRDIAVRTGGEATRGVAVRIGADVGATAIRCGGESMRGTAVRIGGESPRDVARSAATIDAS